MVTTIIVTSITHRNCIVIRPKSTEPAKREKVPEVLHEVELLYETDREALPTTVIRPEYLTLRQERELSLRALREDGLLVEQEKPAIKPPVSEEERAELAGKLSVGRPLSEIIIDEREAGW